MVWSISKNFQSSPGSAAQASVPDPTPMTATRSGAPLRSRTAVIGVGSGTLACAGAPGETWKFFEIDQTMVDAARDPRYFNYINSCQPDFKPVIGDARLTFAKEPDGIYDLIIVDAYSSDAIPIHLATEQAMAIYKSKLAPQGAVLMHVSNRHLELASVVRSRARGDRFPVRSRTPSARKSGCAASSRRISACRARRSCSPAITRRTRRRRS